jgi:hypothetical protein
MSENKDEVLKMLGMIKRPGMDKLIDWLSNETDYFTSPSSTKYHGNYEEGLIDHCLNVYDSLALLNAEFGDNEYSEESLMVVALLHDMCKCNTYIPNDDPASDAQIKYAQSLLDQNGREPLPKVKLTKWYVSKVIDHLKSGEGEFPEFAAAYKVKDKFPMGHGEKSLYLIQKFIRLSDEEALAIRWHLGAFDPGFHFGYPTGFATQQAVRECPLVTMTISADFLATWMVDITVK